MLAFSKAHAAALQSVQPAWSLPIWALLSDVKSRDNAVSLHIKSSLMGFV